MHPDDEFHPPTSDDPEWTETCWFTFTVPERRLSGQLYPYVKTNQKVLSFGCYFWDDRGDRPETARYAKHFWHLPLPDEPLSALRLASGASYDVLDDQRRYRVRYRDPDADEVDLDLEFTAVTPPHYLGTSHLDQPGRVRGTLVLDSEQISVDAFGFRDRSWGPRTQFGPTIQGSGAARGGYSYATASEADAFHSITMDFGSGGISIHGYLLRDGLWAALSEGHREVTERDPATGFPRRIRFEGADSLGRRLHAVGTTVNRLGFWINPNLYSVNCLTRWEFDGVEAWGEDHDNFAAPAARAFLRTFLA